MSRSTREIETRTHETRDEYNMGYLSPLSIPHGVRKDGYSYRWVNVGIKGGESYRVEEMAQKRWEVVPADRSPNFVFDPLERNPLAKKYISYKDVVLMERPNELCKREEKAFNDLNNNKIKSLRGVSNDIGSFAAPLNSINSF